MNSRERVSNLLSGKLIDRVPIFDLLRNEPAIEYYANEKLTFDNAEKVVYKASNEILDATRPMVKYPQQETTAVLADGRKRKIERWTVWTDRLEFDNIKGYKKYLQEKYINKKGEMESIRANAQSMLEKHQRLTKKLDDVFVFSLGASIGLMGLHTEVGLDQFCYYLYDCPELISEALEAITVNTIKKLQAISQMSERIEDKPKGVFLGEDIAFKGTTMFSPNFLRKEFFPRVQRIIDVCHQAGWKVMFHSDGYLMDILDDLVEAGIDLINPVEVAAGMNIKEIHRRHPELIMAGGIDVSNLLPYGKPQEIKDAVKKAIEDAEGKIMVGSSTEMNNNVPLKNVTALYETAINYKY